MGPWLRTPGNSLERVEGEIGDTSCDDGRKMDRKTKGLRKNKSAFDMTYNIISLA